MLDEEPSGQPGNVMPVPLSPPPGQRRALEPVLRIVLACATIAGIHYLTVSVQGRPQDSLRTASSTVDQLHAVDRQVNACIHLDAGDRLIVSSLDRQARRHEVRISWAAEVVPEFELSDVDVVTVDESTVHSAEDRQDPVEAKVCLDSANEPFPSAVNSAAVRILETDSELPSRRFLLPRFIGRNAAGLQSSKMTQQCVDRIAVCSQRAESNAVKLYVADAELSVTAMCGLVKAIDEIIVWNTSHGPGTIADVDGDQRLSIVVCELSSEKIDVESPLLGCVRAEDFLGNDPLGGDMIYLDHRLLGTSALTAVVTHEIAHAAVFSRIRGCRDRGQIASRLPTWLNESIAHSCEFQRCPESPNLTERISAYLEDSGRWPLMPSQRGFNAVSARGPVRAAGLFYIMFMRESQTLDDLIDAECLRMPRESQSTEDGFAETFRSWTVWMSGQQRSGQLPLRIRPLRETQSADRVTIRGTAATWWHAEQAGIVEVSTHDRCRLQLSVVTSPEQHLADD